MLKYEVNKMKPHIPAACLRWIFFFWCLCFLSSLPAYAQEANPDGQIIESLEFRELDIKDALRQLSKQYNLNIVFSEKVSGLVTVQLSNVTIEEAMDSIITVNGFVYTKKDNVIKVTTPDEAEREGKQTKLFKLNNADSLKLKDTLTRVLSPDGSIEADSRSNSLVITDTLSTINKIEQIIPPLDKPTPQVLIEAKFIETSLTNSEKLGIDWQTTIKAIGSKRPTIFPFDKWGSDKDMYPIPKYSATKDSTTGQITVTTDFPFTNDHVLRPGVPFQFGSFPMVAADKFTFGTLDFSSLQGVLDFLKERKKTKLIANPRVVTLNNQRSSINVGRVLSEPLYERNETTGNMEITGWEKYNVGVILEVTPQVSPDGHIRLKLKPEVSSLIGYASTRNGVSEGPITSTRTVETEVLINDGQTVAIGGLVKDESLNNVKKIPILGDIPILGLLFTRKEVGSSSSPTEKTDLLIFVTARIIKDTNEPLLAYESNILTSVPRPFKLDTRAAR